MAYGELTLESLPTGRNMKTGRFVKGHVPANKGRKWSEWMSKRGQRRCRRGWKNLDLHRPCGGPGRPKKAVVAVLGDGRWAVLPSCLDAALWCGGNRHDISRCCRLNALRGSNTDHRHKGIRFYFEEGTEWMEKIRRD